MKKLISVLIVIIAAVSLCACDKTQVGVEFPQSFEADVKIAVGDKNYSGRYRQILNGERTLILSEPESISGLRLKIENGKLFMSFGEVDIDIPENIKKLSGGLSADMICELVSLDMNASSSLTYENGVCVRNTATSYGTAVMYCDAQNGAAVRFICENLRLTADFSNTVFF